MKYVMATIVSLMTVLFIALFLTPGGRAELNRYTASLHKVNDSTAYATRRLVEDTCRAMQASYKKDYLFYMQYSGRGWREEQNEWAEQAKMRANSTAATYNEYVIKNSFVWQGNVPHDIAAELPYLVGPEQDRAPER